MSLKNPQLSIGRFVSRLPWVAVALNLLFGTWNGATAAAYFVTRLWWQGALIGASALISFSCAIYMGRSELRRGHRRDSEGNRGGADREPSTPERTRINPDSIGEPAEGTDPELVVPDSSEAVLGWRSWQPSSGFLVSRGNTYWPCRERLVAQHDDDYYGMGMVSLGGYERKTCDAPKQGCECGIYALKEAGGYGYGVWGEVSLWGRVLEGERGYRAQYAYPKRLWVTLPSFAPVATAVACVEDADERVRDAVMAKAEEVKKNYAEEFYAARLMADQLRENYGIPVELHDPDDPHPVAPKSKELAL